jgi:hypothetical protein
MQPVDFGLFTDATEYTLNGANTSVALIRVMFGASLISQLF